MRKYIFFINLERASKIILNMDYLCRTRLKVKEKFAQLNVDTVFMTGSTFLNVPTSRMHGCS